LQAGDVITALGGDQIDTISDLEAAINTHSVGDTVSITYWRGQSQETASVTLAQSPAP